MGDSEYVAVAPEVLDEVRAILVEFCRTLRDLVDWFDLTDLTTRNILFEGTFGRWLHTMYSARMYTLEELESVDVEIEFGSIEDLRNIFSDIRSVLDRVLPPRVGEQVFKASYLEYIDDPENLPSFELLVVRFMEDIHPRVEKYKSMCDPDWAASESSLRAVADSALELAGHLYSWGTTWDALYELRDALEDLVE